MLSYKPFLGCVPELLIAVSYQQFQNKMNKWQSKQLLSDITYLSDTDAQGDLGLRLWPVVETRRDPNFDVNRNIKN